LRNRDTGEHQRRRTERSAKSLHPVPPSAARKAPPTSKIAPAHSHFKAGGESVSLTRQLSEHDPKAHPARGCGVAAGFPEA